jgi:DNA-binding transcriptional ArsR family regulator
MADLVAVSVDAVLRAIVRDELRAVLRAELAPLVERLDVLAAAAPPALISVEEASKRLQMSPATVRRQLAAGDLPGLRIAGRWKLDVAALARRTRPEHDQATALEARCR